MRNEGEAVEIMAGQLSNVPCFGKEKPIWPRSAFFR